MNGRSINDIERRFPF